MFVMRAIMKATENTDAVRIVDVKWIILTVKKMEVMRNDDKRRSNQKRVKHGFAVLKNGMKHLIWLSKHLNSNQQMQRKVIQSDIR